MKEYRKCVNQTSLQVVWSYIQYNEVGFQKSIWYKINTENLYKIPKNLKVKELPVFLSTHRDFVDHRTECTSWDHQLSKCITVNVTYNSEHKYFIGNSILVAPARRKKILTPLFNYKDKIDLSFFTNRQSIHIMLLFWWDATKVLYHANRHF